MQNTYISIVMPALNEEENIHDAMKGTLEALDYFKLNGEIIVINDGSTDRTESIVQEMMCRDSRVKMICHEHPCGIGASYWDGIDAAAGDVVTWLPGDNENDPREIMRYCMMLEHVDIVIPFVFNKHVRPFFRNFLSYVYRFIVNTTFGVNFNYTNGTVLFRKSILDELESRREGFFFQTDILIRTVKKGYLFAEVPYRLGTRKEGASKAVSFPSLMKVAKGYLHLVKDNFVNKKEIETTFSSDTLTAKRYRDIENSEEA